MHSIPDLPGNQSSDDSTLAAVSKPQAARVVQTRRRAARSLWVIGLMTLVVTSVIVRLHPAPWPIDLQTTITLQQLHLWSWVITPIVWASFVDNPYPSTASFIAWFVVLLLIGVVAWRRGGSPIPWVVTAIFISIGVPVMAGLNRIFATIAARPRPSSPLMHVFMPEPGIPSFPSGHVENDVVYYGFLLYLSLSKPVSRWRKESRSSSIDSSSLALGSSAPRGVVSEASDFVRERRGGDPPSWVATACLARSASPYSSSCTAGHSTG